MVHDSEWVLGLIIVLVYAHGRFNTPKTNRGSTTLLRFWLAACCYYAGIFVLYLLVSGAVSSSPEVVSALGLGGAALPAELGELTGPFLAALMLTALLPNFPLISRVDASLLRFFQDIGNIPIGVRLLSGVLRKSNMVVPPSIQREARHYIETKLAAAELSGDDLVFANDDSPQALWTRAVTLMVVIQSWESTRRYANVVQTFSEQYRLLLEKCERLNVSAARCFPLFRGADGITRKPAPFIGAKNRDPIAECQRTFREQCDDTLRELTEFFARGVLQCELTHRERVHRISEAGFLYDGQPGHLGLNQMVMCTSMVFVILISSLLVLDTVAEGAQREAERVLLIAAMVAAIYGAAVAAALIPKGSWSFARRTPSGARPIAAYVLSGLLAIVAAALISLAFKSISSGDFSAAMMDLRWSYPWFGLSFAAAATTAYLADDYPPASHATAPRFLRWAEGATLSASLVLAGVFVHWMFQSLSADPGFPPQRRIPELIPLLPITALIGFAIGATMPHQYRLSVAPGPIGHEPPEREAPAFPVMTDPIMPKNA